MKAIPLFSILLLSLSVAKNQAFDQNECETLKTSLKYSQEDAPQDISGVLPVIVERVNRELSGVVDVEVQFTGSDIHRRVGRHGIRCSVTRLLSAVSVQDQDIEGYERGVDDFGRDIVRQCFIVPFTILDIDECELPVGNSLRHKCVDPSICINTQGGYECICPFEKVSGSASASASEQYPKMANDSFWELLATDEMNRSSWDVSLAMHSTCPSKPSTHGCCGDNAHDNDGSLCRSGFRCPVDPCHSDNTCNDLARCKRAETPIDKPLYQCICPEGLLGNGHKCRKGVDLLPEPTLQFDGVTPTDETIKNNMYCSCTKPIINPCAGFPKCEGKNEVCTVMSGRSEPVCACTPGFVQVSKYGCVDSNPPILKLRQDEGGDGVTILKQGDSYKEYAVDVRDDNAEDYLRSLKIAYSRPLPAGCHVEMGTFEVNYTVATPWTNPPFARVQRKIIIEDIDECNIDVESYAFQCPELIPQCDTDAGAACKNVKGSYGCQCPEYTSGDGFKHISSIEERDGKYIAAPYGYNGGTGCKDTNKPVIEIIGPNPKVLRTCKCGGLNGIMDATKKVNSQQSSELNKSQRGLYEGDIESMISATDGAELCATHTKKDHSGFECVKAVDQTYKGYIDVSSKVSIGDPVQISPLEWKVPMDVSDDSSNAAVTVWRHIVIEEVDIVELEERIRKEILRETEEDLRNAVQKAIKHERRKATNSETCQPNKYQTAAQTQHGKCPLCDCLSDGNSLSLAQCESRCEITASIADKRRKDNAGNTKCGQTPRTAMHSILDGFIELMEGVLTPNIASIVLLCSLAVAAIFSLQRLFMANQDGWQYVSPEDEEREREMLSHVTYYNRNGARDDRQSINPRQILTGAQSAPQRLNGNAVGSGIFSPPENRVYGQQRDNLFRDSSNTYPNGADSITPSNRPDGRSMHYNQRERYI